jgi:glyoxylase-like metal-dependent hydrolase (beta-lactamase superfamily II)
VQVTRLGDGLWRWTARHPAWTPEQGGPGGWDEEVSCLYLEAPDAVVLVDPLVPEAERDRFFTALDADVERAQRPVAIVITLDDHERSAGELHERYGADVWATAAAGDAMDLEVTRPFRPGDALAGGIATFDAGRPGEVAAWIPAHATLFTGDAILGAPNGLRLCPDSWLPEETTPERFRETLRPLLELAVERVVPAHGEPVTEGAREALRGALAT